MFKVKRDNMIGEWVSEWVVSERVSIYKGERERERDNRIGDMNVYI